MDSERRHKLSQNLLEKWFVSLYQDFYKPNATLIGSGLLAIVAIIAIAVIGSRLMQANQAAQWEQILQASLIPDPDARLKTFETLAENYRSGSMGARVRLVLAQAKLTEGSDLLYRDREKATALLTEAETLLNTADTLAAKDRMLREEVAFHTAMTYESLAACREGTENLERAKKKYEEVVRQWPSGVFTEKARQRQASLSRPADLKLLGMLASAPIPKPADDINVNVERGTTIEGPGEINLDQFE